MNANVDLIVMERTTAAQSWDVLYSSHWESIFSIGYICFYLVADVGVNSNRLVILTMRFEYLSSRNLGKLSGEDEFMMNLPW